MKLSYLGLLLPLGCSGKDDSSGGEESDADTDSDTDTDTDTDTDKVPPCKGTFTDARDGRVYAQAPLQAGGGPTGDCWMAENLDYGEFLPSKKGEMTDNKLPEKYCYDDDEANCATLGGLYQWGELMAYGPSDSVCCRNGAPSGTYFRYSTGAADANGRARMLRKSLAGWVRLITTVDRSGVVTPEIWWPFM